MIFIGQDVEIAMTVNEDHVINYQLTGYNSTVNSWKLYIGSHYMLLVVMQIFSCQATN